MTKLRDAVCPTCSKTVIVTYWPYNVPLYTQHTIPGTARECRLGLRPVETDEPQHLSHRTDPHSA